MADVNRRGLTLRERGPTVEPGRVQAGRHRSTRGRHGTAPGTASLSRWTGEPEHACTARLHLQAARLGPHRGHRRVRDARRRREGQGAQGRGRPVIGFGAGEPDFPTPDYIVAAAVAAAAVPANHRYTPTSGLPELRNAIVAKTKRDSNYEITADQVLVTNGGKQAVYQAFATLLNAGDEVLLPSPYWTTYPECIKLAGGLPVAVFADESQNYLVSVEQLEAARTPKTKVLLFCSPSNPTGSVYSPDQVKAIGEWALKHEIWIISDEIYEHLL